MLNFLNYKYYMESFAKYYEMPLRVDDYCPSYV